MNIHPEPRMREQASPGEGVPADHDEARGDAYSFAGLVQTLWENRWLLAATTGLALGWSAWSVYTETPLYRSTAEVALETANEQIVNVQSVVPQRTLNYITLNTEVRELRSRELMLRAVEVLSLATDPEFNPALREPPAWKRMIDYDGLRQAVGLPPEPRPAPPGPDRARSIATGILHSKVSVSNAPNTVVFTISVETQDPEKSAAIANTIAELYVAGQREVKFEAMEEAMTWLGNRVIELKAELETAEAEIEDYSASAALVSEETLLANRQRLKSMRVREDELASAAERMSQRIDRLAALGAAGEFVNLAREIDDPQLRAAAQRIASGTAAAGSENPDRARFDALFQRWLGSLRADARRAEAQVAAAARSVAELERQVDGQAGDLIALRQMEREAEATRLIYESFLSRLKEISVQQGIQQADSRVMSRANPGYQSHPDVQSSLVKGGMGGLFLGFLLIAARNVLRTSVRTPEELEDATGLTVIGVIPDDRIRRPDRLLERIVERPASGTSEAVRNLRTGIQLSNIDDPPRVVMVTSSLPDEGKSILAGALAQTSALPDRKVLLIDGDLRRRTLAKYFRAEPAGGLIALLSGQADLSQCVHHDPRTGLDLLVADEGKVTPADFFASRQFESFIAEARQNYDLIIIDTPPVLAVPETRVIAQHADAIVYSVRWNTTTRRMVRSGLELLRQVNARHVGLVLTRIDPKRMDQYGYYGYGYGGRGTKLGRYYSG